MLFPRDLKQKEWLLWKPSHTKDPLGPGRREEWAGLKPVSTGLTCSQHAWLWRKDRAVMEQCSYKNLAETKEEIYFYNKVIILYYWGYGARDGVQQLGAPAALAEAPALAPSTCVALWWLTIIHNASTRALGTLFRLLWVPSKHVVPI